LGNDVEIDQRLLESSDPVRLSALEMLNEREASVEEVAAKLGMSVSAVADHLTEMCEGGLIEAVSGTSGGGTAERRYRALMQLQWSDERWVEFSLEERRRLSAWIVHVFNADIQEALGSGSFDARPDAHASRTPAVVDEQGWLELTRIQNEALEAGLAVQAACAERLAEREEEGIAVMSAMFCFEMAPRARPA
jgi:DNA-binding transcriptional ArsR family regulator